MLLLKPVRGKKKKKKVGACGISDKLLKESEYEIIVMKATYIKAATFRKTLYSVTKARHIHVWIFIGKQNSMAEEVVPLT